MQHGSKIASIGARERCPLREVHVRVPHLAANTANTHLEGDLNFSNDPNGSIIIVSWLLSGMEILSIIVLITEMRRSRGSPCFCIKPLCAPYAPALRSRHSPPLASRSSADL